MNPSIRNFTADIAASPKARTGISVGLSILTGLLTAAYVNELTVDGTIQWALTFSRLTFYLLMTAVALNYFYYKNIYEVEIEIMKFSDNEFCMVYARSKLLPDAITQAKTEIRSGNVEEFEAAMVRFKRALK